MSGYDDTLLEAACQGLEAAVHKYCQKAAKRKRNNSSAKGSKETIHSLVQHAQHILQQLHSKRRSLSCGLACLEESYKIWIQKVQESSTMAKSTTSSTAQLGQLLLTHMLTHLFHQYLRLHDGMTLMTSGECRHEGDMRMAQKTRFPSRLAVGSSCSMDSSTGSSTDRRSNEHRQCQQQQQRVRSDGYTKLYSSRYYSGYGWDEFFDPQVGVQHLLQQALLQASGGSRDTKHHKSSASSCWDALVDHYAGAQAFEACLDQHEVQVQHLQQRFDKLRRDIRKHLLQRLGGPARSTCCTSSSSSSAIHVTSVTFASQDKMEKLEVTLKSTNAGSSNNNNNNSSSSHTSTTLISLQRRARDFQVHDVHGCLPNEYITKEHWKQQGAMDFVPPVLSVQGAGLSTMATATMATAVLPSKKRRRIILAESSSDDDDSVVVAAGGGIAAAAASATPGTRGSINATSAKTATNNSSNKNDAAAAATAVGGLRIAVVTTNNQPSTAGATKTTQQDGTVSLIELKGKVNAEALEKSREQFEAEEQQQTTRTGHAAVCGRAANGHAQSIVNRHDGSSRTGVQEEEEADVAESRIKVDRLKRVVARVQERQDEYDEELWDARECLREASMTLGSDLLSLCAVVDMKDEDSNNSKQEKLQEARDCFQKALDLVRKQENVHQLICQQTNDTSEGARAIRRKLLLLRGRAHVNLGIALVELSLMKCPEIQRRALEREAMVELENAKSSAAAIRSLVVADATNGGAIASPSELAMDRIEADQLDSLVHRWLGTFFWQQRRHKDAAIAFEKSWKFFIDRSKQGATDEDICAAEIELGVECFFGCMSLADLALNALEKLQIVVQGHPKRQESLSRGEELFAFAKDSVKSASVVSGRLQTIANHKLDYIRESGVLTLVEIEKHAEEITSWWDEKKRSVMLRGEESLQRESDPVRNDLFSSGPSFLPAHNPAKRFTVNEGASRRGPRRRASQGTNANAGSIRSIRSSVNTGDKPLRANRSTCRRWGDALLPQMKTDSGEMVPRIVYPAAAPELPPGLRPYRPSQ